MMIRTTQKKGSSSSSLQTGISKKKKPGNDSIHFSDNRPESIAQRKLQESIHRSAGILQTNIGQKEWPVQCALRTKGAFEEGLVNEQKQQVSLNLIADKLDIYHQVNINEDGDFQLRLGALKELMSGIHQWFDQFKTGDLNGVTNANYLKQLYSEAEEEHRDLVIQISQTNHLPINTQQLTQNEILKATKIWTDLLKNSGNIEIRETEVGFRNRMLASFAKLLEGQFGRNMLDDLNTGRGGGEKKIIVGDNFTPELGENEVNESEAVPQSSIDLQRSNDHKMLGSAGDNARGDLPQYDHVGQNFDPAAFHDFLIGNDQSNLVKWGGNALKKGIGTGSFVRIVKSEPENIGENDSQIIVPEFVTLGHELGHAQRLLRGAPLQNEQLEDMGVNDEIEQKLWNNTEEFVNIHAVENRIRDEHQLSKRKYHAGDIYTIRFTKNQLQFFAQYNHWKTTLIPYKQIMVRLQPLTNEINLSRTGIDWADQEKVQEAHHKLLQLQQDTSSQTQLWENAMLFLNEYPNLIVTLRNNIRHILPSISSDALIHVPVEIANEFVAFYAQHENEQYEKKIQKWMDVNNNDSPLIFAVNSGFIQLKWVQKFFREDNRAVNYLPQLLSASRQANKWGIVKACMKKGKAEQIRFFELGLTKKEFEHSVDPKHEIDVEIEYDTMDPKARFFRYSHHTYVRKDMTRKKK